MTKCMILRIETDDKNTEQMKNRNQNVQAYRDHDARRRYYYIYGLGYTIYVIAAKVEIHSVPISKRVNSANKN